MPRFLCNLYSVLCTLVPPSHLSTFAQELRSDLHFCNLQLALSPFLAVLSLAPSFNPTAPA